MAKRYSVIFDRDAYADLSAIETHVAQARGPEFAQDFVERIIRYCEGFRTIPHRGTRLALPPPGLRIVGWRRTVTIAFQVFDGTRTVVVLGVFYRGRDVLSALRKRRGE